jgi:hypothetical protein
MSTRCPLCEVRKAKRFCPAKATHICPVCCGEKREREISCPADCVYLQSGREYETERLAKRSPSLARTPRLWEPAFLQRYYGITMFIWTILSEQRGQLAEMVDQDVGLALEGLLQTYRTLESGIYYDHAPASYSAKIIYEAVKAYLDKTHSSLDESVPRLKVSEIVECLQFQKELFDAIALPRLKSRAFLDHIQSNVSRALPPQSHQSSIIMP